MRGAALALALATGASLAACAPVPAAQSVSANQGAAVAYISADELASMVDSGEVVLIDVRTPAEFAAGRLPGALNAPLGTFDPASIPQETGGRETILYCGSSRRSGIAATQLSEYLDTTVRHLEGGIQAWDAAGLETISDDSSNQGSW